MLDLTAVTSNYYDIRLLDGTELHLKRPSQGMLEYLITIKDISSKSSEKEILEAFAALFARILNRNTENKYYATRDLIDEYDFQTIGYVIQDYFSYWNEEVADEVNFQVSQSATE